MKTYRKEQPSESQPAACTGLDYAWLGFCCLGAAVITAVLHSRRCLWFDELTTVLTAQRPFLEGLLQLEDYSAPVYQLLMRLAAPNGMPSETVLRTPAFLSAFLGLVSTWWLAKTLFNKRVAAYAAFLVAFNPVFLAYATEGRPYSLFLFLSVLSIATFYQALRQPGRTILCLYVLSSVLLVYSHYFGFLVLCGEAIFFLATMIFRRDSRSAAGRVLIAAVIIAVAALPALWLSSRYVFTGLA
jgi:mannosyltransferase